MEKYVIFISLFPMQKIIFVSSPSVRSFANNMIGKRESEKNHTHDRQADFFCVCWQSTQLATASNGP